MFSLLQKLIMAQWLIHSYICCFSAASPDQPQVQGRPQEELQGGPRGVIQGALQE